jgi:hypothetical protein
MHSVLIKRSIYISSLLRRRACHLSMPSYPPAYTYTHLAILPPYPYLALHLRPRLRHLTPLVTLPNAVSLLSLESVHPFVRPSTLFFIVSISFLHPSLHSILHACSHSSHARTISVSVFVLCAILATPHSPYFTPLFVFRSIYACRSAPSILSKPRFHTSANRRGVTCTLVLCCTGRVRPQVHPSRFQFPSLPSLLFLLILT